MIKQLPLQVVLVISFLSQTITLVGLISYISVKNSEKIVKEMINNLSAEITTQVEQNLDSYLSLPQQISQFNFRLIESNFLNFDNLKSWEYHLWQQIQDFPDIAFIAVANTNGEYRAGERLNNNIFTINQVLPEKNYTFESFKTNNLGKKIGLYQSLPNKDIREQPWYKKAINQGKSTWSDLHVSYLEPVLLISNLRPIDIDKNGEFDGFLNTTIKLDQVSKFLNSLQLSPSSQVFIVNNQGQLIATSTLEIPFNQQDKTLIYAKNSQDTLTAFITQSILKEIESFNKIEDNVKFIFNQNKDNYYTQVIRYQHYLGLDWYVVVVVPQSDFMAQINANFRMSILISFLALIVAIILGFFTSRFLAKPIQELAKATYEFSQGNLSKKVNIQGVKELTNLAQAFNYMAEQLLTSLHALENINNDLENRVSLRTQELAEAKDKAEVANQAKSTFLANMSHELRTPLNAILGFAQLMMRSQSLSSQDKEKIAIINRSGEYLLTLINNVLDLAKIEAGKMSLNAVKFDLYHLLDELEDFLRLNAEQKGLQLIFEKHQDTPRYIETDSVKLRQVLINLLSNALKFTREGGVSVFVKPDKVNSSKEKISLKFEVSDTGSGIPHEDLPLLFKPFNQTDSGKISQEGTGLGLVISRKFIQLMGGDITVKSVQGEGTTFIFNILAEEVDRLPQQKDSLFERVIGLRSHDTTYRILVVDDKIVNCQLLSSLLIPIGFAVKEAYNGQEALEIWETWQPHLIFMDMRMPIMDGYEATQIIKSTIKGNATAVIALTASVLEEEKVICLSAGCDDFMRKPFRQQAIFEIIHKHLGVEYIYESDANITNYNHETLTIDHLKVMSEDWLKEMYEASLILDEETIINLIKQIPPTYENLAHNLENLVKNFQLEEITYLIEKIIEKDG